MAKPGRKPCSGRVPAPASAAELAAGDSLVNEGWLADPEDCSCSLNEEDIAEMEADELDFELGMMQDLAELDEASETPEQPELAELERSVGGFGRSDDGSPKFEDQQLDSRSELERRLATARLRAEGMALPTACNRRRSGNLEGTFPFGDGLNGQGPCAG